MKVSSLLSLVLSLGLVFSNAGHVLAASYSDTNGHAYSEAIEHLTKIGVVKGYDRPGGNRIYKPDTTINRAEFAKIVIEAKYGFEYFNSSTVDPKCFSDVRESEWYNKYACFALQEKVIEGYPDGSFGGGNTINFAEAAKILANLYDIPVVTVGNTGPWYEPFILKLQDNKYIPPTIKSPSSYVSRGEMAELIWRMQNNHHHLGSKIMIENASTNPIIEQMQRLKDANQ